MKILQSPYKRDVFLIVLAGIILRLIALPWAQTVHADAVSRVHIAYEWLLDPYYIKEGYWGPLHHYLNGLFMLIFPGKVTGPVVLNILCASLTAIPLYGFAINVFNSRKGALLASLLYVFSPIAWWTSLQPLSEVSYGFFLALSLYALSEGIRDKPEYRTAMFAGFFLTCAAAIRYEAWVIIAAFTLVVFLQRSWRYTIGFWSFAMLFPAAWMIGNHFAYGDFLYSVNQNDVWNMGKEGINDDVSATLRMKRVLFFPWSFALNVSPIVAVLLLLSLVRAFIKKRLNKDQLLWLIPFVVMAAVFHRKAWDGSLMLHHRFLVTWLILLLPFGCVIFMGTKWLRMRSILVVFGLISVIPMTFLWNKVPFTKLLGEGVLGQAMDDLAMGYYRELQIIPRIEGSDTEDLLRAINGAGVPGDGLMLDFFGWDRSYYVALHALPNTIVMYGAKHEEYKAEDVIEFLSEHPHGQLVFSRTGMMQDKVLLADTLLAFEGVQTVLRIGEPREFRGKWLYAYDVAAELDASVLDSLRIQGRRMFPTEKDAAYFDDQIRRDEAWYSKVQRQAFWRHEPIDTTLRDNVEYMLSLEAGN